MDESLETCSKQGKEIWGGIAIETMRELLNSEMNLGQRI
jgi:hypothetical protein